MRAEESTQDFKGLHLHMLLGCEIMAQFIDQSHIGLSKSKAKTNDAKCDVANTNNR